MVTKMVLDFLNLGISLPNFNETHIVLILKVKKPKKIIDYRPISLCNVVYKIASKAILNRLKQVLSSIISETQSAFVHGRLITYNVLVAFETMNRTSQKKSGSVGEMTLKLDMSEAYDMMEWRCLEKIMEKLGFTEKCRNLIMQCVTAVTYAIKFNRSARGHIKPSRGHKDSRVLLLTSVVACCTIRSKYYKFFALMKIVSVSLYDVVLITC